jgi:hypothetical protein
MQASLSWSYWICRKSFSYGYEYVYRKIDMPYLEELRVVISSLGHVNEERKTLADLIQKLNKNFAGSGRETYARPTMLLSIPLPIIHYIYGHYWEILMMNEG